MNKIILIGLAMAMASLSQAQMSNAALTYAATIDSSTMRNHVFYLASPELEGRETGSSGALRAADYIADQFSSYGIPPGNDDSYFQEVAFSTIKWASINMEVNDAPAEHLREFLSIPQYFPVLNAPIHISSLTFLGYGIDDEAYSDYKGKDVRGKHLLIYGGEPRLPDGKFRLTSSDTASEWSFNPFLKVVAAKRAGAASVWIIEERFRDQVMMARKYLLSGSMQMGSPQQMAEDFIPHALISTTFAEQLLGKKRNKVVKLRNKITSRGKSSGTSIPVDIRWQPVHNIVSTPGRNVMAYIEGIDPMLKDEIVVVTAHYDHLGKRGNDIFYGADDNASGTSAVLEIAEALSKAKANRAGPRRSVLCMLVTGEEKGLLGSQYYTEHPVYPLENTVANVNIDMIGRKDTLHSNSFYTYVIGADRLSTDLHDINERVNRDYTKLELDYTYNEDDDPNQFYYRSDHYNFAKNGIPAIFYFSGVHDDYHRPTDTPEKLMYGKAERIAKLAFHTTWELANRNDRIPVNVTGRN